jgi:hypothetical protein
MTYTWRMKRVLHLPVWAAMAVVLMCADQGGETKVRLTVPKKVAAQAAARAAGDASSPPPVLMLEDVEIDPGEGLTIQVLGPAEPGSPRSRPVLAMSGMVGQKGPPGPVQRMTLVIPLDEKASRLLKGKSEIMLTLQVEGKPGRPPLKFKRAYFDTGEPHEPTPRQ